jgi:Ca2+-binding RTX toxin-like protein
MGSIRRAIAPVVAVAAAVLAVPAVVGASTVDFSGLTIQVAGDSAADAIGVHYDASHQKVVVSDDAQMTTSSAGCAYSAMTISCPAGAADLLIGLGSGNDTLTSTTALEMIAFGGPGDDTVNASAPDDFLVGGEGADTLNGGGGNDYLSDEEFFIFAMVTGSGDDKLNGGAGSDRMRVGASATGFAGADRFDGGPDVDTLDASERTVPLTITEGNGAADDGAAGEGDEVVNAEIILGGSAGDRLTGGGGANELHGNAGDDVLAGGPGADLLAGGGGQDTASYAERVAKVIASLDGARNDGEAGESDRIADDVEVLVGGFVGDDLKGSTGADSIRGGAGDDALDGLGGADAIDGGDGADTIQARDAAVDDIACGAGTDTAVVDAADVVAADCETVDRPAAPAASPTPAPIASPVPVATVAPVTDRTGPALTIAAVAKVAKGVVTVTVTCPAGEPAGCAGGRATLRLGSATASTATFTAAAGKSARLKLKVSRKLRAKVRAGKTVKLTVSARDQAGNTGTASRSLKLRR